MDCECLCLVVAAAAAGLAGAVLPKPVLMGVSFLEVIAAAVDLEDDLASFFIGMSSICVTPASFGVACPNEIARICSRVSK